MDGWIDRYVPPSLGNTAVGATRSNNNNNNNNNNINTATTYIAVTITNADINGKIG